MTDTPTLDYGRPGSDEPARRPATPAARWFLLILTGVVVHTATRVEVLSYRAHNSLRGWEEGKWRSAPATEEYWRWNQSRLRPDPTLATRPLTPIEQAEANRFVREYSARNHLYETLCTLGLAQHLLAPFACILAIYRCSTEPAGRWRITFTICAALAFGCAILMFVRGYFGVAID